MQVESFNYVNQLVLKSRCNRLHLMTVSTPYVHAL